MTSLLDAVVWVREQMQRDADVRAVFTRAIVEHNHESLSHFARDDPDRFLALYEACVDMVEQIPGDQLQEGRE